jgi:predicted DCC family thiol-disulfide oxidoreductase YuxK
MAMPAFSHHGDTTTRTAASPPGGWVLYDGACSFCSTWVPRFERVLAKRGLGIAPLQAEWVRARLGLADDALLQDVRLLLPGGDTISGADVYRYCMRRIWWARPLWLLSIIPGCRALFDWSYRTFARNRYCVPE